MMRQSRKCQLLFIMICGLIMLSLQFSGCGEGDNPEPEREGAPPPQSDTRSVQKQVDGGSAADPLPKVTATSPEDNSSIRDTTHPVYVDFSLPVDPQKFAFSIAPDPGGWSVSWHNENTEVILDHANGFLPNTSYSVSVSPDSAAAPTKFSFTVYGPSTLQLLDEAERSGELDIDSAWIYRLQSIFEPAKLPERYRSDTPLRDADGVIRGFFRVQNSLKQETNDQLRRYLVRPTHPQSIFNKEMAGQDQSIDIRSFLHFAGRAYAADGWDKRPVMVEKGNCTTTDRLLIWAPKGHRGAIDRVAGAIDGEDIYNKFKQLMGREAIDDYDDLFQAEGPTDQAKNGGDGRIDIYLVSGALATQGDFGGICIPTAWTSDKVTNVQSSAYILIDRTLTGKDLEATLAHELFHAFQYAFDALDDDWWHESTANWSEDYINAGWDTEQRDIKHAFTTGKNRLRSLIIADDEHEYGIYIYPYFLSKEYGDHVIADAWGVCSSASSLDALDSAGTGRT